MIDLADIERVAILAKEYLAERKKYERLAARWTDGVSPKQAQKLNAEMNWQAMALSKLEAHLHAACVDAGVADLRDAAAYADSEFRPSGWHTYSFTPPKPRSLQAAAA